MRALLLVLFTAGLLSSQAHAGAIVVPPPAAPAAVPAGTSLKSVQLQRLVAKLDPGYAWATYRTGILCEESETLEWDGGGREDLKLAGYDEAFAREMQASGFKTAADPSDLFAKVSEGGDLAVAAQITDVKGAFCQGRGALLRSTGTNVHGRVVMDVEWQVYSPVQQAVVARIKTRQGFDMPKPEPAGMAKILQRAFAENARALTASEDFRKVVFGAPTDRNLPVAPGAQARIALIGPGDTATRPISEASGAVVTVFASDGMGSGFLVSQDGYILTNQHVVGAGKYVKLRWPDRFETVGEVVRTDRARDVALIKTDPRGRKPLLVRRATPQPGETVFAIGTPLDEAYQNSVTRGVVSGTRIFDGFNYIQSDVAVTNGNSGGPLLDEKGAVVALTVAGYTPRGVPENINLFIPVGDALDFLAADIR